MSDIPRARELLKTIVNAPPHIAKLLDEVGELLVRAPAGKRRATKRFTAEMTDAVRVHIHSLANKDMTLSEIAVAVGWEAKDLGRVSEVLNGKR